ncbi:protein of unknown function [Legionella fallonii LLAP-10]|uniref:Uncharacterized protein n=1 Tax=Legionella fallonii LLAP-10 TaxID=1212491 RepID=A0A098G822_9GAMM|nr:protein of unknown function [Legionella fallonii LLAP-10]
MIENQKKELEQNINKKRKQPTLAEINPLFQSPVLNMLYHSVKQN